MSTSTLPRPTRIVNRRRRKFDPYANPDPATVPNLWAESVALESLAPGGRDIGLALRRSQLLDDVPSWRLPEVLDSLTAGGTAI